MSYGSKHTTVDGVKKIGSNLYGTCSTGAGTKAKVVDLDGFDVLVEGVTIHVKFDYYNYASNCTLEVGSTEARPLRRNGSSYGEWDSGAVVSFTYDGSNWCQNDFYDTTGYSNTYSLGQSGNDITLYENGSAKNTVTVNQPQRNTYTFTGITLSANGGHNTYTYYVGNSCIGVVGFNVETTSGQGHMVNVWECRLLNGYLRLQVTNLSSSSVFKGSVIVDYLTV